MDPEKLRVVPLELNDNPTRSLESLRRRLKLENPILPGFPTNKVEYQAFPKKRELLDGLIALATVKTSSNEKNSDDDNNWESIAVSLVCSRVLLERKVFETDNDDSNEDPFEVEFVNLCYKTCTDLLQHKEPRLRNVVVSLIDILAKRDSKRAWLVFGDSLMDIVEDLFLLNHEERAEENERITLETLKYTAVPHLLSVELDLGPSSNELEVRQTSLFSVICFRGDDISIPDQVIAKLERIEEEYHSDSDHEDDKGYIDDDADSVIVSKLTKLSTTTEKTIKRKHSRQSMTTTSSSVNSNTSFFNPSLIHETVGWKALETSLRALDKLAGHLGYEILHQDSSSSIPRLFRIVTSQAFRHENRYIREVGYDICSAITDSVFFNGRVSPLAPFAKELKSPVKPSRKQVALIRSLLPVISRGLCDNWTQVRYTASVAARSIMAGLILATMSEEEENVAGMEFGFLESSDLHLMIPRMCLNRFYFADGVRIYSQSTWNTLFPKELGLKMVSINMSYTIDFYLKESQSNNHEVRESACKALGEIAVKLPDYFNNNQMKEDALVLLQLRKILDGLIVCFRDESWSVRDSACLSSGLFVRAFPSQIQRMKVSKSAKEKEEDVVDTEESVLSALYTLFFLHLHDNIWSVREDSAIALGYVLESFPNDLPKVMEELTKSIPKVQEQQHFSTSSAGGRADDDTKFTDKEMFPCCSFGPRLKRSKNGKDFSFSREPEPWEYSDGGIYLLREVCRIAATSSSSSSGEGRPLTSVQQKQEENPSITLLLPLFHLLGQSLEFCSKFTFSKASKLLETYWKQLPEICKYVGKKTFKVSVLDLVLRPLILSCSHENRLLSSAARNCFYFLQGFVGESILLARIENMELDGSKLLEIARGIIV